MKKKPATKPAATVKKRRGRPKNAKPVRVISRLRLRDTLKQLEADTPAVESAEAVFKVHARTAVDMLRLYKEGHAVFISRGILRAIIAELG